MLPTHSPLVLTFIIHSRTAISLFLVFTRSYDHRSRICRYYGSRRSRSEHHHLDRSRLAHERYMEQLISASSISFRPQLTPGRSQRRSQMNHDFADRASDASAYIRIETRPVLQGCQRRCPCQCHVGYEGNSPRWLSGLLGAAFVKSLGLPFFGRRRCNSPRCSGQSAGSGLFRVQYVFPQWFLQRVIEATATWGDLQGIGGTWTLRIPRFVTEDDILIAVEKCIRLENCIDSMELMGRHNLRPCDMLVGNDEMYWPFLRVSPSRSLELFLC